MSYTPTEWSTGDTITAALLNKMENGIAAGGGGNPLVTLTFPYGAGTFSKYFNFCIVDGDGDALLLFYNDTVDYSFYMMTVRSFQNGESMLVPLPMPVPSDGNRLMFIEDDMYIYSFSGGIDSTGETIHINGSTCTGHEITGDCTISVEWD